MVAVHISDHLVSHRLLVMRLTFIKLFDVNFRDITSRISDFLGLRPIEIGIDLGTANTLVNVRGQGIVLREPSVVAVHTATNEIRAVGDEAKRMLGRAPGSIKAIRPLKDGVIADFEVAQAMLSYFITKINKGRRGSTRIVVAVPSGITAVEKKAVEDAAVQAGARDVQIVPEPMAAAIGVGLPVEDPSGSMIVDIGGGTTEVAIMSLSGIVVDTSVRTAGDAIDTSIVSYLRREYNLMVGDRTAEDIKIRIGSAFALSKELTLAIKGRDTVKGLPKTIDISSEEIRHAIAEPIMKIVDACRVCLERCPPELAADLVDRGVVLAGGGALIKGLDRRLREETGLPVHVAEDPLSSVAEGTGILLEEVELLEKVTQEV